MAINPNWPVIEHAWGPMWNANGGDIPLDRYVEVTGRAIGTVTTGRGRQYELDQVQAGTLSAVLSNTDGALDPMNASGPWAGNIRPYQPFRIRAQYPPTPNLLTQVQATGGDLGGIPTGTIPSGNGGIDVFTNTDPAGGSIVASASAFRGTNVFQFAVPSGIAAAALICWTYQNAVTPGATYSVQMQVRNVVAGTSIPVQLYIGQYNASGGFVSNTPGSVVTLTGSPTAAWSTVTVTATAPQNTYGMYVGLVAASAVSTTCTVQVDGWQLEKAATPSTFTVPGITYPLYAGFVERWPSKWEKDGTYGVVSPTAVDAFALLSQRILKDPLTQELYSRYPTYIFPLSDPQNSQGFADATGNFPAATIGVSKYGAGSLTSGNQITSASAGGTFTGSTGSVVTLANQYPGTNLVPENASFISLSNAGITGPSNPAWWTRMLAFRYTGPTPTAAAVMWSAMDGQRANNNPSGSQIQFGISTSGNVYANVGGPSGTYQQVVNTSVNVCDGNWHLMLVSWGPSINYFGLAVDNAPIAYSTASAANSPTGIISDCVGAFVDATVGNGTTYGFQGDIAFAAEFNAFLYPADVTAIYSAWKNSFAGDSTDQRYARILKWAGYTGVSDIGTGQTRSMGPAVTGGQDALSALAAVVETENGVHYVSTSGTVTFRGRGYRYNNNTPIYVFGENGSAGEWPYEEVELDYDSTHLANQVTVTQGPTSAQFIGVDLTSQANYFPRTMSRTVNSTNALECQDAANYLVSRYHKPLTRVTTLKLHPSAYPALWPVCLSLELNMRVRIMRRPFGAPPIQIDAYIENIQWDIDDQNEAVVTLQCSPADLTPYGVFASFHTTLYGAASAGATTLQLKPGSDSTNPLAAQISSGQPLILDPGTANAETVTVLAVGSTTSGWTNGTITLTAATVNSHPVGAVVCEPLPSGVTNPAAYDVSARFDSSAFSY